MAVGQWDGSRGCSAIGRRRLIPALEQVYSLGVATLLQEVPHHGWRRWSQLLPELGRAEASVADGQSAEIKAQETELRAIWAACDLRNDRIRAATGVEFRPFDESLRDCVESLLAIAKVKPHVA